MTVLSRNIRRLMMRLDSGLDQSAMADAWQRFKWMLKYRIGRPGHVPDFEKLLQRPHRQFLLRYMDTLGPWRSVLELGCGRGVNLFLLAQRHPEAELEGLDISSVAIEGARHELARRGVSHVRLAVGSAAHLEAYPDHSVDIVLADALLMYIPPEAIGSILSEMLRVARVGVLAGAWHIDLPETSQPWRYDEGSWVYDFRRIASEVPGSKMTVTAYPESAWQDARWRRYGAIISASSIEAPGLAACG